MGENWKQQTGVTVGNTTVTTSGYASSVPAGQTNILEISNQPARLSTQGLVWQLDNENFSGDNRSTVQMNFSRPVRNLAFSMEDIDISTLGNGGSDFVDEVTFNAYAQGSTTPYQLVAADVALGLNGSNIFVAGTNTIEGTTANSGPGGTVVLTYPAGIAISRLEIIYRNTQNYTAGNLRLQTIGIPSMVWCAVVDLSTTLTGPAYAQAGGTVAYTATTTNQGNIDAAGVNSTVQLVPGLLNVTIDGTTAGTQYNTVTGLLTLPAIGTLAPGGSRASVIRFTMPATGSVTGQAKSTTTGLDADVTNNNGTAANANVTTVQNQPPVANNVTVTPAISVSSGQTGIAPLTATDPNGNSTIASYRITSTLPPVSQGTFYVNGVVLNTTNFPNLVLTPTQVTQLTFDPSGTYVGNVTFQYTATDDFNISDATPATYTLTISNQPPVAISATNVILSNTAGATVLSPSLSGTDADGTVASFSIKSLPATGTLSFNGAPVVAGVTSVPANQLNLLRYTPASGQLGIASFTFTAIDNNGAESATATYSIPVQNPAPTNCAVSYFDGVNSYSGLSADYVAGTFSTNANSTGDDLAYFVTRAGTGNSIKRIDAQLNFTDNGASWGNIIPPASGSATDYNTYSSRYRGSIFLAKAGVYTFYTSSDDASYLWIDGAALPTNNTPTAATALVNNGGLHGNVEVTSVTVRLSAGLHNVLLFFSENGGGNVFTFSYAGTAEDGTTIAKQVVPNAILCAGRSNLPPVALNVTNSPAIPNSFGPTAIASLAGSDADGTVDNYIIATLPTAEQGVLSLNGTLVTAGQQITAAQAAQLQFNPTAGFVGNATFTFHAVDNTPQRSNEPATYTIPVAATTTISGTIFEDVNYGGGAGRNFSTANSSATGSGFANNVIGRNGATVELYDNATGLPVIGITATATSTTNGTYTFTGVPTGSYTVRVVNSTVSSVRNTGNVAGLLPVQTFVRNGVTDDVNRVGGEAPAKQDAAANTGAQTLAALTTGTLTPQSITTVTIASTPAAVTAVDFGFNFNTVTNTNDAGAGSLRQFISNSNALPNTTLDQDDTFQGAAAGREFANFMLPDGTTTGNGLRAGVAAASGYNATTGFTITLASTLPIITDANTVINGGRIITGEKVAAVAGTTTGPEVTINFASFGGLETTAANTRFVSIGLTGAKGTGVSTTGDVSQGAAITLSGAAATGSIVNNITAYDNATAGVRLENGVTGVSITNSILRNGTSTATAAGVTATDGFGIVLEGATNNTITGNTLSNNAGSAITLGTSTGTAVTNTGNRFELNTISGNGGGAATLNNAGIRIRFGQDNLFLTNTITGNDSDGIIANSGTSGNRFSQNSFSGHNDAGDLGIDLTGGTGFNGDDTNLNADGKTAATGANGILNFPVITQLSKDGTSLRMLGYAPANAVVEFFVADVQTATFGEGLTYIASRTEGTADDADNKVSNYSFSGFPGEINQGSETNARRFSFTIPLSSLTAAQQLALNGANARITATATVLSTTLVNGIAVGNTSEFSGNIAVTANPLPVELKAFEVAASNANALLTWSTASEQNNDHFDVERSFDGGRFERIGQVQGRGTTSQTTSYSFTDTNIGAQRTGVVYYRLQQVDTDGTASYSPVRTVRFAATAGTAVTLGVFPNPATTQDRTATLDLATLPQGAYQATLLDATGRIMGTYDVQGGVNKKLDIESLPAGTYLVLVRGNGLSLNQRLIKK
ncbi:beta strand repeat-containing protein [Hymenobacter canadensis]|uniref:Right-handed parallel beta-helix repeat-containing protein n=1 Tax=Hymenobacter canadensis TaxID=2999067 RepID=A0ABY7LKK0_9BACT|nr:right-handed parallel beta-helix repeat-containing protein [Hymenobacter canadensis]WBA40971.1 right-handed parallel beta-helix repeat-containing protein [Hymenobacter canadensis]